MDHTDDVTLDGECTYDYFGISVSDAGDMKNDGMTMSLSGLLIMAIFIMAKPMYTAPPWYRPKSTSSFRARTHHLATP
jgi:hypothetical protein